MLYDHTCRVSPAYVVFSTALVMLVITNIWYVHVSVTSLCTCKSRYEQQLYAAEGLLRYGSAVCVSYQECILAGDEVYTIDCAQWPCGAHDMYQGHISIKPDPTHKQMHICAALMDGAVKIFGMRCSVRKHNEQWYIAGWSFDND